MGWNNVFHCEWEEFPRKVLNYHWPNAISYGDIKETDFTIHQGGIDILTGGFPCQPYSTAGKQLGKEDDRHLWPEMLRAIREIQPKWVVGENVRGLINWNGGLVFDEVQADLEAEGYQVQPFLLPACAVNAPHRRDRIWFVSRLISDTGCNGCNLPTESKKGCKCKRSGISFNGAKSLSGSGPTPDTKSNRDRGGLQSLAGENEEQQIPEESREENTKHRNDGGKWPTPDTPSCGRNKNNGRGESRFFNQEGKGNYWQNFPTQSPVCSRNDGFPGTLDNITFSKWRNESIKAYGNAIVPQVALQIFKAIEQYESLP